MLVFNVESASFQAYSGKVLNLSARRNSIKLIFNIDRRVGLWAQSVVTLPSESDLDSRLLVWMKIIDGFVSG